MSAYGRGSGGQGAQLLTRAGVLALGAAVALLVVERADDAVLAPVRDTVVTWSAPGVQAVSRTVAPVRTLIGRVSAVELDATELDRLRAQNRQLQGDLIRVGEVEREYRELVRLLGLSTGAPFALVAARVVSVSPDLVWASMTVGVGQQHRVGVGDGVVAQDVLVGRIVRVGAETSAVVRLVDVRSRVPVVVGAQQVRAVLSGDGTSAPRLEFISPDGVVREGDSVLTSGVGGVIARGLVVGRVVGDGAGWRVQLPGGSHVPRVVGVLRQLEPGEMLGVQVGNGREYAPGLARLGRQRLANRMREGGAP
jgi:rod shape-determining protein MreC